MNEFPAQAGMEQRVAAFTLSTNDRLLADGLRPEVDPAGRRLHAP